MSERFALTLIANIDKRVEEFSRNRDPMDIHPTEAALMLFRSAIVDTMREMGYTTFDESK